MHLTKHKAHHSPGWVREVKGSGRLVLRSKDELEAGLIYAPQKADITM